MKLKKILGKDKGACIMPLSTKTKIPNTKTEINFVLSIADNLPAILHPDKVKSKKGCYILIKKGTEILHAIKISRKEAYKLLKSDGIYEGWRIK